ncbi:ATP-binding cassette domain-containing protein [Rhodococcus sp. 3Y1]
MVGDNGAGKSTLMKILAGAVQHDGGEMRVNGEPVRFSTPLDAQQKKIGIVYQDLALCDTLDVASNLFLGREPRKAPSSTGMPCTRRRLTFLPTCMSR